MEHGRMTMKKLWVYMKDYAKESILGPLFKLLEASFELFVPLVMAAIIDTGIANGDKGYIFKMCGVLIGLAIIGLVCSITAQYFAARASVGFASKLRSALFAHIQKLSYTQQDQQGVDTLITRMTSDINQVQSGLNLALRLLLRSPFVVFGAMVMAFTIDVKAALVFVVTIPLLSIVVFGIMLWSIPMYKKVQQKLDRVLGITRENLTGARVLRAFCKEQEEVDEFTERNDTLTKLQNLVGRVTGLMNPVTYVLINLGIVVLIWVGAMRVNAGILSQGQVVALYNYMSQILVELIKLASLIISITKAMACAGRVSAVMDIQPDMAGGSASAKGSSDEAVRFCNVQLTYAGAGAPSLTNVDFSVKRGQTIGVIGGTGSGKTSLVNLIPRFYDATRGSVELYGQDVKRLSPEDIRRSVGMVPQKTVLFSGSIADNVRWGKTDASDADVLNAIDGAQGTDILSKKNEGMNAPVGQGGRALSGGQRQRVAIARALVRNADILILDDSASALDFATDARLRAAIRARQGSQTVFIVSQRASGVRYADRILVMDEGRVSAQGTHEELMQSSALYREIYFSQFPEGDHVCESR